MSSESPASSGSPAQADLPGPGDPRDGGDRPEPDGSPAPGAQEAGAQEASRPGSRGWRFLISPRWLGWHLLMVALVVGMLALGDWQLRRAESGNALSWAYTFEWPIFAGFVIVFWAKTIRDEFHPPGAPESAASGGPELPGGTAGTGRRAGADEDEDDEELAEYNAYLARLTTEVRGHGKWHGLR